jgi:hypothetical protein
MTFEALRGVYRLIARVRWISIVAAQIHSAIIQARPCFWPSAAPLRVRFQHDKRQLTAMRLHLWSFRKSKGVVHLVLPRSISFIQASANLSESSLSKG